MGVFHKLSMTIALISLMALLVPFPVARADEVATFPDPHLQARVREAIEKPVGDIYRSDLTGLTNLSANSEGITDLSGLEYCTSLTYLSLWRNKISNISPLVENSGLSKGATVDLMENPLDTKSVDVYIPQLQQRGVNLGWGTSHPTTHPNSYTQARSTVQHMGDRWPNPRSPSNGWRGVLLPEKVEVKARGIPVVCFGLLSTNVR
jgi:hypothetical protein